MKTILCYGDSNTWGWNPHTLSRYGRNERWPGVLRNALGQNYWVIEEGQNGRTTVWDDPIEGHKNGLTYLPPCLDSHHPLDLVIIMLGSNDLKARFSVTAFDIAQSAGVLVDVVQKSAFGPDGNPPQVLLMSPPVIGKLTGFAEIFEGGVEKSRKLVVYFRQVAEERKCYFLDAAQIVVADAADGVHLDRSEHEKLGKAVASQVRSIFSV
jgi:lysophospholipase L1-like esterase